VAPRASRTIEAVSSSQVGTIHTTRRSLQSLALATTLLFGAGPVSAQGMEGYGDGSGQSWGDPIGNNGPPSNQGGVSYGPGPSEPTGSTYSPPDPDAYVREKTSEHAHQTGSQLGRAAEPELACPAETVSSSLPNGYPILPPRQDWLLYTPWELPPTAQCHADDPMQESGVQPATDPASKRAEADPVSLRTGEFVHRAVDLEVLGGQMAFGLVRSYRSRMENLGPLGPGWDHSLNARVLVSRDPADTDVTVSLGDLAPVRIAAVEKGQAATVLGGRSPVVPITVAKEFLRGGGSSGALRTFLGETGGRLGLLGRRQPLGLFSNRLRDLEGCYIPGTPELLRGQSGKVCLSSPMTNVWATSFKPLGCHLRGSDGCLQHCPWAGNLPQLRQPR